MKDELNEFAFSISVAVSRRMSGWRFTKAAIMSAMLPLTAGHFDTARAQNVGSDDGTQLSEVVVTAQKRSEDLKDVPLSISVLKGDDLEQQKVSGYEDLARIVPSLSVTNTGGSSLSRLSLRGVSSELGSATVGIYLNDISLSVPNVNLLGQTLPRPFDLAQIEVLRGPQGTLFGASSLGGAIRFIPNEPKLNTFEGEVQADVSNTHLAGGANHLLEAVVNIPLVDNLMALRLAVQGTDDKGFITQYDLPIGTTGAPPAGTPSRKVGDERTTALRASLLVKPDDSLSIEPSLLYQRSYSDGTNIFDLSYLPEFAQNRTTAEEILDVLKVGSLTVHKDFDAVQLTSITGYVRRDNDRLLDGQSYDSDYVAYLYDPNDNLPAPNGNTIYNTLAALKAPYINNTVSEQFSQELRAASRSIKESGKPYEWQVGAFFSNQAVKSFDHEAITGLGDALTNIYGIPPAEVLGAPLVNDVIGYFPFETHTFEHAIFGQASYVILPKLTATVGLRKSWADIRYDYGEYGFFAFGGVPEYQNNQSASPTLPKFSLSYELTDNATVYTTVAKGYRLGGSNPPLPPNCGPDFAALGIDSVQSQYNADSLWSYEGGAKLRFLDNRLRVNAAAYFINWSNIQQSVYLPNCGYTVVVNAGKAHSYGGEWDITAQLTRGLSLTFAGAITDAHITDAALGSGATDGQSVLEVPRANFSFGPDYQQPIGTDWVAHAHFDVNYTGTSHGTFDPTQLDYNRPDYTVVNLNAGLARGPLDVSFFARNLFDDDKEIQTPSVLFIDQGIRVRPRTLGVSVKYKF